MQQPIQYGNQPYQQQQYQQQPVHGFVYVTGMDGAKAYQMPPNSEMPLFDSTSENRMFIKTTDGAGFPTIRAGKFIPEDTPQQQQHAEYATADDVAAIKSELKELRSIVDAKHISSPSK